MEATQKDLDLLYQVINGWKCPLLRDSVRYALQRLMRDYQAGKSELLNEKKQRQDLAWSHERQTEGLVKENARLTRELDETGDELERCNRLLQEAHRRLAVGIEQGKVLLRGLAKGETPPPTEGATQP